ncbi:MAG: VOC family protein [Limisphaerales bacterium]
MTINHSIQPYLIFNGRCEEAVEFYRKALGAEVMFLMRFKDAPDQSMIKPGVENKIMHTTLKIGDTIVLASDGHCTGQTGFSGFSLSLAVKTEAEADKAFAALSDGGEVTMPLTKTFFSPLFGMVIDRFGISWMIIIPQN